MKLKSLPYILPALMLAALTAGCIRNDIPYPRIQQSILTLAAEDEALPAVINDQLQTATVYISETTDPAKVRFTEFTYSEGATSSTDLLDGTFDLLKPIHITLSRYQDYDWTIEAVQQIERYFTIDGQVGQTIIDVPGRRIVVRVPKSENLADLRLTAVKLGPEGLTTMVPDLQPGRINLAKPLDVDVTAFGRTERWTIFAEKTDFVVNTSSADAWSQVIWVYGESQRDLEQGFQYRPSGSADWIDVDASEIVSQGTTFHACIKHLKPLTRYDVRAWAGEDFGRMITVTTQSTEDIPNGDFDDWWLDGKLWNPWAQDGEKFWDTGNKGAVITGVSNSAPSDYTPDGQGRSARLETIFASIAGIGKLAAGNIFTGSYLRTSGTNGVLGFGRPWTLRPTKLRGYFQYDAKIIDRPESNSEFPQLKGRPDSCHIYVALADWTAPYEIRTSPSNRQLFDKNMPSIIAYGELIYSGHMTGWQAFEIPLTYRSTSRVPTYLQITVSSSKYGDYFIGGTGSLLYVDQFSFDYDY